MTPARRCTGWNTSVACPLQVRIAVALASFAVVACSGPTDIVATLDRDDTDVQTAVESASSSASDPGSNTATSRLSAGRLVIAGRPVPQWQGATYDWPLATPLDEFFADPESEAEHPPKRQTYDSSHAGMFDKGSGDGASAREDARRVVTSTGANAVRLLELFARAPRARGEPLPVVVRDDFDDLYVIVLESASCGVGMRRRAGMACLDQAEFE